MSDGPNSPLSNLWRGALVLCGIAVLVWIAAKLIASVWLVLVIVGAVVVITAVSVSVLRWWLRSRRW